MPNIHTLSAPDLQPLEDLQRSLPLGASAGDDHVGGADNICLPEKTWRTLPPGWKYVSMIYIYIYIDIYIYILIYIYITIVEFVSITLWDIYISICKREQTTMGYFTAQG